MFQKYIKIVRFLTGEAPNRELFRFCAADSFFTLERVTGRLAQNNHTNPN